MSRGMTTSQGAELTWSSWLRSSSLFLAGLLCLIWGIGAVFAHLTYRYDPNEVKVRELLAKRGGQHDVVFIGNSVAMQAFDPRVFDERTGSDSYNLGLGSTSYAQCRVLLEFYLRHNAKPKRVILSVLVNNNAVDLPLRPTLELSLPDEVLSAYRSWVKQAHWVSSSWLESLANHFAIYRFRKAPDRLYRALRYPSPTQSWYKGFLAMTYPYRAPKRVAPQRADFDEAGLKWFAAYCEAQGIELIAVECPDLEVYTRSYVNRSETLQTVSACLGAKQRFLRCNEGQVQLGPDDWTGTHHLSASGAHKFTAYLAEASTSYL